MVTAVAAVSDKGGWGVCEEAVWPGGNSLLTPMVLSSSWTKKLSVYKSFVGLIDLKAGRGNLSSSATHSL